jgi:hypothetical protein
MFFVFFSFFVGNPKMGNNSSNDKNKTIIRENKGPKKIQIKRTKLEEKIMIN